MSEPISIPVYSLRLEKDKEVDFDCDEKLSDQTLIAKFATETFCLSKQPEEVMVLLTLNNNLKPTGLFEVSRGSLDETISHPREVFKRALLSNACYIALIHNHPSGDCGLSQEDIELYFLMQEVGNMIGIECIDVIAVGDDGTYHSAKQETEEVDNIIDKEKEKNPEISKEEIISRAANNNN